MKSDTETHIKKANEDDFVVIFICLYILKDIY